MRLIAVEQLKQIVPYRLQASMYLNPILENADATNYENESEPMIQYRADLTRFLVS